MRRILAQLYGSDKFGLGFPGMDDEGSLSCWYVLSAMGFFPVDPATENYALASPLSDEVTLFRLQPCLDGGTITTLRALWPFVLMAEAVVPLTPGHQKEWRYMICHKNSMRVGSWPSTRGLKSPTQPATARVFHSNVPPLHP